MPQKTWDNVDVGLHVFELIEFSLDRQLSDGSAATGRYGVNVTKVREVVRMPKINPLASTIAGIAGVFELRGVPIPAINLAAALGDKSAPITKDQQIIVTEFSYKRAGFIVKSTEKIRRIAWEKVLPPTADAHTCISGMTLVENQEFLFILDLERVLLSIEAKSQDLAASPPPQITERPSRKNEGEPSRQTLGRVLLVDDSNLILNNTKVFLMREGFEIATASNGLQAKEFLERYCLALVKEAPLCAIITDVEMPKMDGLSLTRWIKSHPQLQHIPVILHTSLSGTANLEMGQSVGAEAYVIKNDINMLLASLRELCKQARTVAA